MLTSLTVGTLGVEGRELRHCLTPCVATTSPISLVSTREITFVSTGSRATLIKAFTGDFWSNHAFSRVDSGNVGKAEAVDSDLVSDEVRGDECIISCVPFLQNISFVTAFTQNVNADVDLGEYSMTNGLAGDRSL